MERFENAPIIKETREQSEEKEKKEIEKKLLFSKEKKELLVQLEKDSSLTKLKSALERGLIRVDTLQAIMDNSLLDIQEVSDILSKIDELELLKDIDTVLPKDLRLSSTDYLLALEDDTVRSLALIKLDSALVHLHSQIRPQDLVGVSTFEHMIFSIQKTLVVAHDTTIDIKRSLV